MNPKPWRPYFSLVDDTSPRPSPRTRRRGRSIGSAVFLLTLHFLERLHQGQMLVFSAQAFDVGARDWFQQNALRRGNDGGLGAVLNLELLAQAAGNDHLALGAEAYGIQLQSCNHGQKLNQTKKECQTYFV